MPATTRREGVRLLVSAAMLGGLSGCGVVARAIREEATGMASPGPTDKERARIAWQYFRTARSSATGLVDTSAGGGFTTTATLGDQIAATICAYRLGAIDKREFDAAITQLLVFLTNAPLAGGQLPARFYGTASGQLVDPPNQGRDPGWSGVQLGRLLTWLRVLADDFGQYAYTIAGIVERWQVCAAIDAAGTILEGLPGAGGLAYRPDRASGYEAYAVEGYRAWGLSPLASAPAADYTVEVEGMDFAIGASGAPVPPLHVAPYALIGIETGWRGDNAAARREAERIFAAQDRRRKATGIVTARSDFRRNSAPYALTGAVVAGGTPWGTSAADGVTHPALALVSTKAAFGMWALGAPSAREAMAAVSTLYDSGTGWLEGRYEASGGYEWTRTAATNALVLEAVLYREVGVLAGPGKPRPLTPGGASGFSCAAGG